VTHNKLINRNLSAQGNEFRGLVTFLLISCLVGDDYFLPLIIFSVGFSHIQDVAL